MPVAKVDKLVVRDGGEPLVDGLSFEAERGSVLGIVGANRAAVRSVIFALAGQLPWDAGRIDYSFPSPPLRGGQRMSISSFLGGLSLPPKLLVREALRLHGRSSADVSRTQEVVDLLQLGPVLGRRCDQLTRPLLSRTRIAICLARDEDLFVVDYLPPEIGEGYVTIARNYLASMTNLGRTVVVATDEPEGFCGRAVMIRGASSFEVGEPEALKRKLSGPGRVELTVRGLALQAVEGVLVGLGSSWIYRDDDRMVISCADDRSVVERVVSEITNNGGVIEGVKTTSAHLLDLTRADSR